MLTRRGMKKMWFELQPTFLFGQTQAALRLCFPAPTTTPNFAVPM
jgi:hypothetical protein